MKRKISFTALGIIFILLLISVRQNIVNADDQSEVMYTFQENEDLDLFINLPYNNLISEKCLIDNQEAKISEFYTLEDNCLVETVFLFDEYVLTNNPDIQKNAVQITKDILKNAGKNESPGAKKNYAGFGRGEKSALRHTDSLPYHIWPV